MKFCWNGTASRKAKRTWTPGRATRSSCSSSPRLRSRRSASLSSRPEGRSPMRWSPYPRADTVKTALILFNRDLRVHDNPALAAAARAERTVPLFVLDEQLLGSRFAAPNRVAFMREALPDLDEALKRAGGRLFVRRGDPVARGDRGGPRVRRRGAARQRRLQRLRDAARAAPGSGLRGGADRLPRPPRDDDRAARRRHPRRRRSLQGLHPLPPRLERAAAAAAGRAAAASSPSPAGSAPAACRRWRS